MKNILLISSLFLILPFIGISCTGLEKNQSKCEISGFKFAGTYNWEFRGHNVRDDTYYVDGFENNKECYRQVNAYLDSLEIDTSGDHMISFLKYDETLPEFYGSTENSHREAFVMTFSSQRLDKGFRTCWHYSSGGNQDSVIEFDNGVLVYRQKYTR